MKNCHLQTSTKDHNNRLFEQLRKLKLPKDQYFVTGSGPLGVRGLRKINDIDLIVTESLWKTLATTYGVIYEEEKEKIVFPNVPIEAFKESSFLSNKQEKIPSFFDRLNSAEFIEGVPFESLEHVKFFKIKMGRPKDLKDIELIRSV